MQVLLYIGAGAPTLFSGAGEVDPLYQVSFAEVQVLIYYIHKWFSIVVLCMYFINVVHLLLYCLVLRNFI